MHGNVRDAGCEIVLYGKLFSRFPGRSTCDKPEFP